ncbi:MAG TPA: NAD-dependent epimerase/dehydratase family protein [Candidatus Paceibacterota bacterium]
MEDFWHKRNVLVTGGNGFLGSYIVKELIRAGVRPVVLIYEENPNGIFEAEHLDTKSVIVRGDIRNLALMDEIMRWHKIDTVFHLAAQAIVDQAIDDPLETFEVNIQGTWNILEACKRNPRVRQVIVASSDKAYGDHDVLPYAEHSHHLKAAYPYEVSKAAADMIAQTFHKTFNIPVCITRCANVYGPGDMKMNRLVPRTIFQLHTDKPPVIRDTGSSVRDYLYVEDAAEAYRMLAEQMDESMHGEAFNFSTNQPISVAEAIKVISREMKKKIAPKVMKTHGMEIRHQYASFDKAQRLLGWKPTHDFVSGIKKTIPWYVRHIEKNLKSVSRDVKKKSERMVRK